MKKEPTPSSGIAHRNLSEIWNANAASWDERHGDGDAFSRYLVFPSAMRLLQLTPSSRILEIACGNGSFARLAAKSGVSVVATDFSQGMLDMARNRTLVSEGSLEYRLLDASQTPHFAQFPSHSFDAAICNMALMDMPTLGPMASGLKHLLKSKSKFVFTVSHPCFFAGSRRGIEEEEIDGARKVRRYISVASYGNLAAQFGVAFEGQAYPHPYFHRTLSSILLPFFSAGFSLTALEEPVLGEEAVWQPGYGRRADWELYRSIPPILTAAMRS